MNDFKLLNLEQIKSIKFGMYYCSACAKSFERADLKIVDSSFASYLNCPHCTQTLDVEYNDD